MPPRTPTEAKLASIWCKVFDVEEVGIDDNFFELGGHSLLAIRLMALIQQKFAVDLPLATLFQSPTIEKLALHLYHECESPAILILDEATSSLDAETAAAINKTISEIAKERAVISISHHLASVTEADKIFVLEQGRVVEEGTHEELLSHFGLYAQMWHTQTAAHDELVHLGR